MALSRVDSISLHLQRYQIDIKSRKQYEPEQRFFEVPTDATAIDYLVQLSLILQYHQTLRRVSLTFHDK